MRLALDASRLKRATASGSCTMAGFITLMALRRPIFTCSARYTWPMALAQFLHYMVAVGQHLAHEIVRRPRRAQRLPIVRAESHVIAVLGRTDGADLHVRISICSSLSPTRIRD